ncbi:MAG: ComF family protein [Candidatus Omnitrophica bacterium]|nr:ComF family protein [Candidatus Omnitrophota bacterium]MDD5573993.1 ComF family protein [Candidatus Omnitrophota bacterium]
MFKGYLNAFFDLFFPKNCHICSRLLGGLTARFDDHLCQDCFSAMKRCHVVSCRYCGAALTQDREIEELLCRGCRNDQPDYQRLLACYAYDGPVRLLIHRFKYDGRPYLARTIAALMTRVLPAGWLEQFDVLVPVPLHPSRRREREFNQAALIASTLARDPGLPVIPALKRTKNTRALAGVKRSERRNVLDNAFCLDTRYKPLIARNRVLLVDDIVTTTATVRRASRLLSREASCRKVCVLSFAKG